MTSKRSTPLDDPPSASSDDDDQTEDEQDILTNKTNQQSSTDEEDDDAEEEEEEEEEESEEETKIQIPVETPKIQNPNSKVAESSSEEESGSESEEETPTQFETSVENPKTLTPKSSSVFDFDTDPDFKSPAASDFAIKPSKRINVHEETPEKTPTSKRLFPGSDLKEKKKIKVSNGDVVDDEKKSVVKRVWSDDDELLLLQGFIDYQSKKGCSPLSDMDGFYQFTMDSLPGNASKSQLYEKIRRLKKKFRVNSEKVSENGEDPVFPKPHERKLFEISKKIWGINGCENFGGSNANSNVKSKTKTKTKPKVEVKDEVEIEDDGKVAKIEDFKTLYPHLNAGLSLKVSSSLNFPTGVVHLIKDNLSLIGEAKAKELDEKWKALFDNETVLRNRRIALLGNLLNLGK